MFLVASRFAGSSFSNRLDLGMILNNSRAAPGTADYRMVARAKIFSLMPPQLRREGNTTSKVTSIFSVLVGLLATRWSTPRQILTS
eukprot:scaffold252895_cov49-Attheya_sp.AAC.1